jgi:hypothetical protein
MTFKGLEGVHPNPFPMAGENGGLQGDIDIQGEDFNKWFAGGLRQPVPHPIFFAQENVASRF